MTAPVPEDKLRLGGMALRNGLLVHGPTHWAAAVRTDAGELKVASGRKPDLGGRAAERVPGVRGVLKLAEAMEALAISSTGFFPDGKWSGMAKALQEPGTGEQLLESLDRDGFAGVLRQQSPAMTDEAIDDYWKAYADEERRRGQLELYRSGDFSKLERFDLAALGVPALLVWGEDDEFAPVAGAHRFERELPATELVVVKGARHFVWDDAPEECGAALTGFLARVRG